MILPTDPKARKNAPVYSGFLAYFPRAVVAVAELSRIGNEQHNPGSPLHWDRSKSGDEADALVRHLLEHGSVDTDGVRHTTKAAWRAMALLEKELEASEKVDGYLDTFDPEKAAASRAELAASEIRPSYIPDGAWWGMVTDGLGRQVGAWVAGTCVRVFDPDDRYSPWFWRDGSKHWNGTCPALTESLYNQCLIIWEMRPSVTLPVQHGSLRGRSRERPQRLNDALKDEDAAIGQSLRHALLTRPFRIDGAAHTKLALNLGDHVEDGDRRCHRFGAGSNGCISPPLYDSAMVSLACS